MSSCSNELEADRLEHSLVSVQFKGTQSQLSQVNIEILDVQLKVLEDGSDPNAWISLNTINTGIHDMTLLTQDQSLSLVDFEEVPSGFIYNIKIVYGDRNTVTQNGIEHVLNMTSEFENASINVIEKQLSTNILYDFTVEFEIDKSVLISSDGNANLSPKINTLMRRFELF